MPTTQRLPIHPPYLVNRVRSRIELPGGETTEDRTLLETLSQMLSELHRYLRYLRDSGDITQQNFVAVDQDIQNVSVLTVTAVSAGASPYTVQADDNVLLVDASAGAVTITLPNALQSEGRLLRVKKIDSGGNLVTLSGNVDGDVGFDLLLEDEVAAVVSDGTEWWII